MDLEYKQRYDITLRESGCLKSFPKITDYQWTYNDELAAESNVPTVPEGVKKLFKHFVTLRKKSMMTENNLFACLFRNNVYRLSDDQQDFIIVYESF